MNYVASIGPGYQELLQLGVALIIEQLSGLASEYRRLDENRYQWYVNDVLRVGGMQLRLQPNVDESNDKLPWRGQDLNCLPFSAADFVPNLLAVRRFGRVILRRGDAAILRLGEDRPTFPLALV